MFEHSNLVIAVCATAALAALYYCLVFARRGWTFYALVALWAAFAPISVAWVASGDRSPVAAKPVAARGVPPR